MSENAMMRLLMIITAKQAEISEMNRILVADVRKLKCEIYRHKDCIERITEYVNSNSNEESQPLMDDINKVLRYSLQK